MGNPDTFYKKALQDFAYCLTYMGDKKLAKELSEEKSISKLEQYILQKKEQIEEREFFFEAGRTFEHVVNEAYETGNDAMNASIGGLYEFECLIGLRDDEE